jgi:pyrophosphatase PpaX
VKSDKIKKKAYRGVIFDMDGTLTRTNELIFAAFNYIAERYLNSSLTPDEIIRMFGPPEDHAILTMVGDARYESALKDLYDFYREHHDRMARLYDGMFDTLSLLHRGGVSLGIFTGKGRVTTDITLRAFQIEKYFSSVVTGHDVDKHKPSGEGILRALEQMGIGKEDAVMIGDSVSDVTASHEAGVDIATVLWDSYGYEKVVQLETDYRFHTVDEFREWIRGWLNHSV